ncbi:CoA transferase [Janthinobacterium sp. Mn2066]|uniref:CoA transferase n=1 Tax=Janthinobacterium sp. Mn2066 TaxID=3395264 RepID=UPI003BC406C5
MTLNTMLHTLWTIAGNDTAPLNRLRFSSTGLSLPSTFHVGPIASATIGAQALMAAEIWRWRTGREQEVRVDQRHALAQFRSERYLQVDGKPAPDPWSPIAGYYQAGDGRWIQLHTNFPHHHNGVLNVLQCADSREAVAAAIKGWKAEELDARLAQEGLCAAMIRSPQEWQAHPQAAAIAALPLFEIERISDTAPLPLPADHQGRPLGGVRVLDLSRVIAAPVGARTLAQHGADVLAISAAHLPNIPALVIDTGRGKRPAQMDLRQETERERLRELIRGADIFIHAYRPGSLAARGFSSAELQALKPGLVEVCLSAYSHAGPWAQRRGFDSLVQSASGIAWAEGQAQGLAQPGKLPCQALDHASGYIAALGAMAALKRRAVAGGGWRVRLSLAQTGAWLQAMGTVEGGLAQPELSAGEIAAWSTGSDSPFGRISAITPAEQMTDTPPYFALPPSPLDAYQASWL